VLDLKGIKKRYYLRLPSRGGSSPPIRPTRMAVPCGGATTALGPNTSAPYFFFGARWEAFDAERVAPGRGGPATADFSSTGPPAAQSSEREMPHPRRWRDAGQNGHIPAAASPPVRRHGRLRAPLVLVHQTFIADHIRLCTRAS